MPNGGELSGLRILVVEDEAIVAWDLAFSLESHGCEVVGPAYDLAEAERLSRDRALNGAILDVNLGGEKVFPVADALAERHIPFCFVTGYGTAALRPRDLDRPILQKPIDSKSIVRVAQNWRRKM
jgi:CheY-like chemotaxis protein